MVEHPPRRRRLVVGTAVLAVVLAGAGGGVAAALSGAGGARRKVARAHLAAPARPQRRRSNRLAAVMATGNSRIRQLIPLGLPLYCGGHHGNEVAFTFDDGPGVYTHYAVKKLAHWHERATFFVVGKVIILWPGWLRRELRVAAIGDHTYDHFKLPTLTSREVNYQLASVAHMIHSQTGEQVDLWRPPYLASDSTVVNIARRLGLLEVIGDVDSRDWAGAPWYQIINNVEAGLHPGAIVMMHENRGQTIRALTTLLPYLHRDHLRSVSIPELMAADPPSAAQLRQGLAGCGHRGTLRPGGV